MSKNSDINISNNKENPTKDADTIKTKKGNMGNALSAQTRAIIFNVLQFAFREKKAKTTIMDINKAMDRVAAMTGLCRDTLSKIKKEGSSNGGVWENKVKKKRPKVITNPNDVDKIHIINKIEEFEKRNEAITLRKLHSELKQENNFSGGRTSLLIVLRSMGYKWEKNESNKKVLQKVPISPKTSDAPKSIPKKDHNLLEHKKESLRDNRTNSFSPICNIEESTLKQNAHLQKFLEYQHPAPIQGPSHLQGPSPQQVLSHPQGPSHPHASFPPYNLQRPLLLHPPHIFNHM